MRRWRTARLVLAVAVAGAMGGGFGGCTRVLLSPEQTRSPFDSYDSVRNQYARQKNTDELGRETINLRQRLAPKE